MSDNLIKQYRPTIRASYVGYVVQAIVNNFLPLLFITFQKEWDIPLSKITSLITINFLIQLCVDLTSSKLIPKIGYRKAVVFAHFFAGAGMISLGILPFILPDPYIGLLISILMTAIGGGLIEVIISPIVEACPAENKAGQMSFLHSAYCWGHVLTILLSTAFFIIFGTSCWRYMAFLWSVVPIMNGIFFIRVPIRTLEEESGAESIPLRRLAVTPIFWVLMIMMVCSGASELAMAQWASDFAESGLGVSKTMGDLLGACFFAVCMGTARVIYAKISDRVDMTGYMIFSSLLCVIGYLITVFAPDPIISLIGCGVIGFSVGVMWPGTYSIAASAVRGGGTAMFALLALGGDLGCSGGPTLVGVIADSLGGDLKSGLIWAIIFPVLLIAGLIACKKISSKKKE